MYLCVARRCRRPLVRGCEQLNFHKKSNLFHFVLISDFSEEYKTNFNFKGGRHCQLDPHDVPLFYVSEPENV